MRWNSLSPWLLLPFLSVWGAAWLASGSVGIGLFSGAVAALSSALMAHLALSPLRDDVERLTGTTQQVAKVVLGNTQDLSDPQRAVRTVEAIGERSRKLSLRLDTLGAVLEGMADGVWMTNEEGTIVRNNEVLCRLLHCEGPLAGKRPITVVRSAELQAAVTSACTQSAAAELSVTQEDGRILSIRVAPLGKGLQGSAAIFRDVTELRQLEKVRRDFVANVSHELATPITAIRGYAETLRDGAMSDPVNAPKMVEIIHRQAQRLSQLVQDLLELSRLESRTVKLEQEEVCLADLASQAIETVAPKAQGKSIVLSSQVPPALQAWADRRGIEQVLLNLLENAIKYTPTGGSVEIRARSLGQRCQLEVIDTGVGIEAAHLPRIFERFYRVDPGRSRDMGGTGLGLAIVKHLVTTMGGEVKVESEPGRGSTFSVLLPSVSVTGASSG